MNIILLILGMALVTYIPRLLPALFMDRIHFPGWFQKWLQGIPYAALGALIFPGILLVEADQPMLGLAGGIAAFLLAILEIHVVIVMVGSIGTVLLLQQFLY